MSEGPVALFHRIVDTMVDHYRPEVDKLEDRLDELEQAIFEEPEARLSQAYVDINKGTVTSDEHVDVKLLNGTLTADRLRIINSGEIVRFEGNVVMNLIMESPPAPEPELEPPPPPRTRSVTGKSSNTK